MSQIPETTPCIEFDGAGGTEVIRLGESPLPALAATEVLIEVSHAGINRPDVLQRQGNYPPPKGATDIPGLEVSGTVIATGDAVTRWQPGDEVCALLISGGYAKYAVADASHCLPVPDGLTLEEAASLPETAFTTWHNLVDKGRMSAGDNVLIHGGSSGIGTMGIQLARALGARVFTTAGSDEKCRFCEELGAEKAFNYRTEEFTDVKKLTDGYGMDVILDIVGGDYVQKNIKSTAAKARIVNIAFLNGSKVTVDLMPVMLKQLVLTGSTLRSKPADEKSQIAAAVEKNVWPLLSNGQIRPVIHRVFPLSQAAEAHELMESSAHIGKILLDCRS